MLMLALAIELDGPISGHAIQSDADMIIIFFNKNYISPAQSAWKSLARTCKDFAKDIGPSNLGASVLSAPLIQYIKGPAHYCSPRRQLYKSRPPLKSESSAPPPYRAHRCCADIVCRSLMPFPSCLFRRETPCASVSPQIYSSITSASK